MQRIAFVHAALVLGIASCSVRTQLHSEAGHELAVRLCAVHNDCNCDDDLIIPDCEARVEREFAENERKARNAGLVYNSSCMEGLLERLDTFGTCENFYPDLDPLCPVYGANDEAGEPCEFFDLFPVMYNCRPGLACIDGICKDLVNHGTLPQGSLCSEDQNMVPTGNLGECEEGLRCDSADTRTCVPVTPVTPVPQAPLGEDCVVFEGCLDDNICRPQGDDQLPSEDRPGVCVERTPPGEPCTLIYECDWLCEDGFCHVPQPAACEVLRSWWELRKFF